MKDSSPGKIYDQLDDNGEGISVLNCYVTLAV
jgi:hypothetical protein